jgi:site-specific DNA recombinase
MNTALYMRVSTMEQATEGYSLQSQKRKLLAYCEAMNWNVCNIYSDEGISGSSIEKRPAATKLLEDVKNGKIENVLIMKVDRLCRNTKDLLEIVDILKKYNVRLNAVDEKIDYTTDVGKMVLTMLGSFAEFERNRISSRMIDGRVQKVMNGVKSRGGKILYGYNFIDNQFIIKPLEATTVRFIYDSVLANKSYHEIARTIATSSTMNYNHLVWTPQKIKRIVTNPTYKGYCFNGFTHNDETTVYHKANNVEPIIDEETWETANYLLKARHNFQINKTSQDDFAFGDVAYCGVCGHKMNARTALDSKQKNGKRYYYRCLYNKKRFTYDLNELPRCAACCVSNRKVEKFFLEYFDKLEIQPVKNNDETISVDDNKLIEDIKNKIALLEKKRFSLSKKFVEDLITADTYSQLNEEYNQEAIMLEEQLNSLENKKSATADNFDYDTLLNFKIKLREMWDLMSKSEKRNFITLHFEKIYITKTGITNVVFRKAN